MTILPKSVRIYGAFCYHTLQSNLLDRKRGNPFRNWKGRKFMSTISIRTVTVIGAGTMGSGIAQTAAASNYLVNIVDLNESNLIKCKEIISHNVDRLSKKLNKGDSKKSSKYQAEVVGRINFTQDISCVKQSQLVIEAIAEDLDIKRKLFKQLEQLTLPSTLLVTNTSSISIADLSDELDRKENVAGLHFFNPVPIMKLVELIRSPYTSQNTCNLLLAWTKSIGKSVVQCKDTPGFIVNRLLIPTLLAQAVLMLERGEATKEDIDTAMKFGCNFPMGPFELIDYIGVDIVANILKESSKKQPEEPLFATPKTLLNMITDGKMGRKSGEGFYKYEKKK